MRETITARSLTAYLLPLLLATFALSSCSFPGSVKPTVKIGLSAPFEGLYRATGYEVLHAVRLAVRQRNDAGGVGDRYLVELVALNDYGESDEATLQAHELAADPSVLAVAGGWSSATARSAAPEYQRQGIAFVSPPGDWTMLGEAAASLVRYDLNLDYAAVLRGGTREDDALADAFATAFTRLGGAAVQLRMTSGQDWAQELRSGDSDPFDLVFIAAEPHTAASRMLQARQAGFSGVFVGGPSLMDSVVADLAGDSSEGALFVSHLPPIPEESAFLDGYKALSGDAPPGPLAAWAYKAANRMLDAMDTATRAEGQPTRASVAAQLETLPELDVYVYVIQEGVSAVR